MNEEIFIPSGRLLETCACGQRVVQVLAGKSEKPVTVEFRGGPMVLGHDNAPGYWGNRHVCPNDAPIEKPKGRRKTASPLALSRDLSHERHPNICQACGARNCVPERNPFFRWREYDDWDKETEMLVVLCQPCASKSIDSHPRLYDYIAPFLPMAGSNNCCTDCVHRRELLCGHPEAKANGGEGVILHYPPPTVMFLDYSTGKKGCGRGGHAQKMYLGPVTCDQYEIETTQVQVLAEEK